MKPKEPCKEMMNEVIFSTTLVRIIAQIASFPVSLSIAAKILQSLHNEQVTPNIRGWLNLILKKCAPRGRFPKPVGMGV
jgi:hypothetical protein